MLINGRKQLYLVAMLLAIGGSLMAATYEAGPDNLRDIIGKLQRGDVVLLADGEYEGGVVVKADGAKDAPIRIRAVGANALFVGGHDGFRLEGDYIELEGIRVTGAERGGITAGHNTGCAIRKCTCYENGSWGIFSGFSEHLSVEDNECFGQKRQHGIYLSNSADYAVVRRNHCHHNAGCGIQFNGDPYIKGGDGVMRYNLVENNILHDNHTNFNFTCVAESVVRGNLFYGCNSKAIALWDTGAGYEYSSKNNLIINNTFVMDNVTRECIHLRNGATGNVIRNNIFVDPFFTIIADPSSVEGTVIDHNLYCGGREPEKFIWAGDYRTIEDMQGMGFCKGAVTGKPPFVDQQTNDFHLVAGSPAIDAGADDERIGSNDLDGNPRVVGAAVDLGAYEFRPAK